MKLDPAHIIKLMDDLAAAQKDVAATWKAIPSNERDLAAALPKDIPYDMRRD